MKINKLTLNSPLLPSELSDIPSPPKELFYKGSLEEFSSAPRLAVVGSRKVSAYGRAVTERLVQRLVEQGVVIISGLALGVDSVAHSAALDAGGRTYAVLANGLHTIYPSSHIHLAKRMLEHGGAIISEYPEGTPGLRQQFIARNRLISGLSEAVLITEAAEKSGSLHTAQFALEQGRTVFAVPGNITSATSAGTNNLIKAGALPVTDPSDVLSAMGWDTNLKPQQIIAGSPAELAVLTAMKSGITDSAELLVASKLDVQEFNQTLTMLEIQGRIRPLGAGHWTFLVLSK
jgi:DNA processing protein